MGENAVPILMKFTNPAFVIGCKKIKVILFVATCKWRKKIGNLDTKIVQEEVMWNPGQCSLPDQEAERNRWEEAMAKHCGLSPEMLCSHQLTSSYLCKQQLFFSFWVLSLLLLSYTQHTSPSPSQTTVSDSKSSSSPIRFTFKNTPNPNNFCHLYNFISLPAFIFSFLKMFSSLHFAP